MRLKRVIDPHDALAQVLHGVELFDLRDYIVAASENVRYALNFLNVTTTELCAAKKKFLRFLVQVLNFSNFSLVG